MKNSSTTITANQNHPNISLCLALVLCLSNSSLTGSNTTRTAVLWVNNDEEMYINQLSATHRRFSPLMCLPTDLHQRT